MKSIKNLTVPCSYFKLLNEFKSVFKQKRTFKYFCMFMIALTLFNNNALITRVILLFNMISSYTNFYRFFSKYKWSINDLSIKFLEIAIKIFNLKQLIIAGDDTLVCKYGKKIFGCSIHFDHARKHNLSQYIHGLNWVTLGLIIDIKGFNKTICFPFMSKLFVSKKSKSRIQIMIDMLKMITNKLQIPVILVVDGLYAKEKLVTYCKKHNITLISRFRNDANLYLPYETESKQNRGRPRKYGDKIDLKGLETDLLSKQKIKLELYDKIQQIQYLSFNAVWRRSGDLVKVIMVKYNNQKKYNLYFCTDLSLLDTEMIKLVSKRWGIEVAFTDLKEHFGLNKWQIRNKNSVERSATFTCINMSVLLLWSIEQNPTGKQLNLWDALPWYRHKRLVSIIDVKEQFREHCLKLILKQLNISLNSCEKSENLQRFFRYAA